LEKSGSLERLRLTAGDVFFVVIGFLDIIESCACRGAGIPHARAWSRHVPCRDQSVFASRSLPDKHRQIPTTTCSPDESQPPARNPALEVAGLHDLQHLLKLHAVPGDVLLAIILPDKLDRHPGWALLL
jgi:hypothetical protein